MLKQVPLLSRINLSTKAIYYHIFEFARYYKMSGHKKDPSPEFQSFAIAQLEILPSPTGGEGTVRRFAYPPLVGGSKSLISGRGFIQTLS